MIGRGRILTSFILVLLVASALPIAIVPTAQAAAASTAFNGAKIQVSSDGVTFTDVSGTSTYAIGKVFRIFGTASTTCNGGTTDANVNFTLLPTDPGAATLQSLSGTTVASTTLLAAKDVQTAGTGATTTPLASIPFTIASKPGGFDGTPASITFTLRAKCGPAAGAATTETGETTSAISASFNVDQSPPRLSLSPSDISVTCTASCSRVDVGPGLVAGSHYDITAHFTEATAVTGTMSLNCCGASPATTSISGSPGSATATLHVIVPSGEASKTVAVTLSGVKDASGNALANSAGVALPDPQTIDSLPLSTSAPSASSMAGPSTLTRTAPSLPLASGAVATMSATINYASGANPGDVGFGQVTFDSLPAGGTLVAPVNKVTTAKNAPDLASADPSGTSAVVFRPVDNAGNPGGAGSTTTISFPSLASIGLAPTSADTPVWKRYASGSALGHLKMTPTGAASVTLTIQKAGGGAFLKTGMDGSHDPADFTTTPADIAKFSGASGDIDLTSLRLVDGKYTFEIIAVGTGSPANTAVYDFDMQLDKTAPTVTASAPSATSQQHGNDGNPIELPIDITDAGGLATVQVVALSGTGLSATTFVNGAPAQWSFTPGCASPGAAIAGTHDTCGATPSPTNHVLLSTSTHVAGTLHLSGADAATTLRPGLYAFRVIATDATGNSAQSSILLNGNNDGDQWFTVGPRSSVLADQNVPFAHAAPNGGIELTMLAAVDAAASAAGSNGCQTVGSSTVCPVTTVAAFVRSQGTDGDGTKLVERDGVDRAFPYTDLGTNQAYFQYARQQFYAYPTSEFSDSKPMEVRVMATQLLAGGQQVSSNSSWIAVKSSTTTNALIASPPVENAFTTVRAVPLSLAIPFTADTAPGDIYAATATITNVTGNFTVAPATFGPITLARSAFVDMDSTPHYLYYNGTFNAPSDAANVAGNAGNPMRYTVTMKLADSSTGQTLAFTPARHFTFQTTPASIGKSLDADRPFIGAGAAAVGDGAAVNRTFDLNFTIVHQLQGLTPANFTFDLRRGETSGTQAQWIHKGDEGYSWTLPSSLLATDYGNPAGQPGSVTLHAVLPTSALDGQTFTLYANVSTNGSVWADGVTSVPSFNQSSLHIPLQLDSNPPAPRVDATATSQTGLGGASFPELSIIGSVQESGGIGHLDVRVVDLTHNQTLNWGADGFATWESGVTDRWATSTPKTRTAGGATYSDVQLASTGDVNNVFAWSIPSGTTGAATASSTLRKDSANNVLHALPLGRGSLYRLDVRVWDGLGHFASLTNVPINFDASAPIINGPPYIGCRGATVTNCGTPVTVNYHGFSRGFYVDNRSLLVAAYDTACLGNVSLMGIAPDGTSVGPFPMQLLNKGVAVDKDANGECGGVGYTLKPDASSGEKIWTLDTYQHPELTDEAGTYTYWPVARDAVGNVNATPTSRGTLAITVVDTLPAEIVDMDPAEGTRVPAGQPVVVGADIREAAGIDHIDVLVFRGTTLLGTSHMHATANVTKTGSGRWEMSSADISGLSIENGVNYTFQAVAYDTNYNTTCTTDANPTVNCRSLSVTLQGTNAVAIAFKAVSPPQAQTFIGPDATLVYEARGANLSQSALTLLSGPLGNLTNNNANATFTALANASGFSISLKPNLTGLTNYSVRLSGAGSSASFDYTVDRTPPALLLNATGSVASPNATWIGNASRISIVGVDNQSGGILVTYSVNGGLPLNYSSPFAPTGADGAWNITATATDAAGNVATARANYTLDKTGPTLSLLQPGDNMTVTANDDGIGLDNSSLLVHYAYGPGPLTSIKKMDKLVGNTYQAALGGNATQTGLRYYIDAKDLLGNTGSLNSAGAPGVIAKVVANGTTDTNNTTENLAPTVTILAPTEGASLHAGDPLTLRYAAVDANQVALTITAHLLGPNAFDRPLLASEPNDGILLVNTSALATGTYAINVTANDGALDSNTARVTFSIVAASGTTIVKPLPTTTQAGQETSFAVNFTTNGKKIATASFTVEKDGKPFTSGTLKPTNGSYGGAFTPTGAGAYTVRSTVIYSDTTSESATIGTMRVTASAAVPSSGVPISFVSVIALAAVTAGLAAYGAFGRWRK